jgi:hypothetical protein
MISVLVTTNQNRELWDACIKFLLSAKAGTITTISSIPCECEYPPCTSVLNKTFQLSDLEHEFNILFLVRW